MSPPPQSAKLASPSAPLQYTARVRVRHAGCVTETITDPMRGVQIGEEDYSHLILLSSPDAEQLDAFVEEFAKRNGRGLEVLHRRPDELLFRGRASDRCVTRTLRSNGSRIVWPATYADGWEEFTVLASSERQLREAIQSIKAPNVVKAGPIEPVTGGRLPMGVTARELMDGITGRQLEVLRVAVDEGYYEAPRRVTTERLAEKLGITTSTLKEHLRKAEESLVTGFESVIQRFGPVVAQAVRRGRNP